jgi:hypothetical protein
VNKEPWDSSTNKGKTLRVDDFGSPDEVTEKAQPVRYAETRRQAVEMLKDIANKGSLTSKSGLTARLSTKVIGKIVSNQALNTSISPKAHYMGAVNVDYLFTNAIEPWKFELNPAKNNDGLKDRHYLYAPIQYENDIIIIKITVKEYIDEKLANKLYSIEAIDTKAKKNRNAGTLTVHKPCGLFTDPSMHPCSGR